MQQRGSQIFTPKTSLRTVLLCRSPPFPDFPSDQRVSVTCAHVWRFGYQTICHKDSSDSPERRKQKTAAPAQMKSEILEMLTRNRVWNKASSCDPCYLVGSAGGVPLQGLNYKSEFKSSPGNLVRHCQKQYNEGQR